MKKIYCEDCKFYCYFNSIYLSGYQPRNPHQCASPENLIKEDRFDAIHIMMKNYADEINKNNDCKYYCRKWYKFWK